MFLSRNKKNNVHPCKSKVYYIEVGFKEVKIIYVFFRDVSKRAKNQQNRVRRMQTFHAYSKVIFSLYLSIGTEGLSKQCRS